MPELSEHNLIKISFAFLQHRYGKVGAMHVIFENLFCGCNMKRGSNEHISLRNAMFCSIK